MKIFPAVVAVVLSLPPAFFGAASNNEVPGIVGSAKGITLVRCEFNGSGAILQSTPDADLEGGGWKTSDPAIQPRMDGEGRLVSGGNGSVAAIMLPPISPSGEVTIAASVDMRGNGPGLNLGFTESVQRITKGPSGPWLKMTGGGQLMLHQDATTMLKTVAIPRSPSATHPVMLTFAYRLWQKTLTVAINGKAFVTVAIPRVPKTPLRCFTIEYESEDAGNTPALDSLRIEYIPRARPEPLSAHRTIQVTDTSMEGITKAMRDASAISGSDNVVEVSIPKGDYHFRKPDDHKTGNSHIFWTFRLKYLIVNWNGSRIFLDRPHQGLQNLSEARHVVVKNIASLDYSDANLPFTQGTIRAIDAAKQSFDLEIDEGFPLPTGDYFAKSRSRESWGQLIDPAVPGRRKAGAFREYWIRDAQHLGGRLYRYFIKSPMVAVKVGDRFTDNPRPDAAAMFRIFDAQNVTLQNITGYACGGFWSMIYNNNLINYFDVKVLIKPGRLMSGNADVATGTGNKGVWIENCEFAGNADDICHQFLGSGIFITRSTFRNNRRFGVWFNTSEFGVITDCRFEGMGHFAIAGMKEPGMKEEVRFASRNVLCAGNTFQGPAIGLQAMNARTLPGSDWNTCWRVSKNTVSSSLQIRNATDVILSGNEGIQPRQAAKLNIDQASCKDIIIQETNKKR